jgi:Cu-processing system permease protein
MNVVLLIVPLIATMFGVMYYYNSREFIELLLAQPIKRSNIFLGQYIGIAGSLSISLIIGIGLPFIIYGVFNSAEIWNFMILLVTGVFLSFIFSAIALLIALKNENRIKGFGLAILVWLFLAVIYDGIFLLGLIWFNDYPLDQFAIIGSVLNPIDLSRILILLKLDISALMGYTGAVFQNFFGTALGMVAAFSVLIAWIGIPAWRIKSVSQTKDF